MPFVLVFAVAAAVLYAMSRRASALPVLPSAAQAPGAPAPAAPAGIAACRAAIVQEPGLTPYKGGHMYGGGRDKAHVAYLRAYLDKLADAATGEDKRRILAFKALLGREGSTAAINTYDNQIVTWGTGWGGLGMLPSVMDRLVSSPEVVARLAACGVRYAGKGVWEVDDGKGHVVRGKREGLEAIKASPELLNLLISLARDPATRDAVTRAQLDTFKALSGNLPGSETIGTQGLFNFAVHLKHWAPGFMVDSVNVAASKVPGAPSEARDRTLAPEIVRRFYERAHAAKGWIPDWKQLKGYVGDMKTDGLDVTADAVLSAPESPVKAVA